MRLELGQLASSHAALKRRRTKIVATLGPASSSPEMLHALIDAGVDVVRLNFSHQAAAEQAGLVRQIRASARKLGRHVAILGDLAGPKIRTGRFAGGSIELEPGASVIVTVRSRLGGPGVIPSQYRRLTRDVRPRQRLLLDDGNLELQVERIRGDEIACRVVRGGRLSDRKGINLPDSRVSAPALTRQDRADVEAAVRLGVDYLGLSFVRRSSDVRALRRLLARLGSDTPIVAKIETPQALDSIAEILAETDAIMVARGDLGVELPAERVPVVQRELVRLAMGQNRPVIIATQMLESMVERSRATRAEVSDVANAAFAGADAVMLSAETATGKHPLAAVSAMDRILREVEGYLWTHGQFDHWRHPVSERSAELRLHDAISRAAALLSRDLDVRCIVVPTRSGTSARSVAADRPAAPIVAVGLEERVCRRVALYWGVIPWSPAVSRSTLADAGAREAAHALELALPGDPILIVRGLDVDPRRSQPMLKVLAL